MCASIRWDGAHCLGSTAPIFSAQGRDITVLPLPVLHNGFSVCFSFHLFSCVSDVISPIDFVLSKVTPTLVTHLGYKLFLMFATINIAGMGTFSLLIPETKGRSLEEMDVIFGSVKKEEREKDIQRQEKELGQDGAGAGGDESSTRSDGDRKV